MGYSVYQQTIDHNNNVSRWAGYGVPAYCDHPGCTALINRGMGYACCNDPSHTQSCGGFYCSDHQDQYVMVDELEDMTDQQLETLGIDRSATDSDGDGIVKCTHGPLDGSKEHPDWLNHILTDQSWEEWRKENPDQVGTYQAILKVTG